MEFEEFVDNQNEIAKTQKEFDRELVIDTFREKVNSLYAEIETWLESYIESGRMQIGKKKITITEEKLGEYEMDTRVIHIGQSVVVLEPHGTRLIGTNARVDIKTYGITYAYFVRAGENVNRISQMISITIGDEKQPERDFGPEVWKIVLTKDRKTLIPMTQESFEQTLIDAISNG